MLRTPQLLERPRFASQLEAEAFELCEGGSAEFVPRRQAAFTAVGAVPPAGRLWRGCRGQSALPLGGSGKDPPGEDTVRTFPLGNPWSSLGTWTLAGSFCSQYLSPPDLH